MNKREFIKQSVYAIDPTRKQILKWIPVIHEYIKSTKSMGLYSRMTSLFYDPRFPEFKILEIKINATRVKFVISKEEYVDLSMPCIPDECYK